MNRHFAFFQIFVCLAVSVPGQLIADEDAEFAALQAEAQKSLKEGVQPFVKKYCTQCHGNKKKKAGLNYEAALKRPGSHASRRQWELAVDYIADHEMPPEDEEAQPTDEERELFAKWIGQIKFLSPKDPGRFVMRRLTSVEYGNTLRDLFGVDPAIAEELPDEIFGAGYLNSLSPLQSEQYLGIANDVLDEIQKSREIQKKLFGDEPKAETDFRKAAGEVARSLARQAYRRPPTETEIEVLLKVFDLARENDLAYSDSLGLMLKAILVSPQFLFIMPAEEVGPEGGIILLDDFQLASRLSYLFWSTMPDGELLALAENGTLHKPEVLKAQTIRLLKDDRSRALFDGFGAQWLGLDDLDEQTFDPEMFPQMTDEMRLAMFDEARLFFDSIVRENQSVVSFVDSDYTFINETLAPIYGLEKTVSGPEMRRVNLTDPNRGGILGMPGGLATTSFPNRASPVNRGVWVLEKILGEHVPPAPANVPTLEKQDEKSIEGLTLRERTELHVKNPSCASCHKVLDPIGFGLENFDAIGRWREVDSSGGKIDATGELPDEGKFSSPRELKAIIAGRKNDLARNLTERFFAYALGRPLEGYDEIVVDQMMEKIAKTDYKMQTLLTEVVTSYSFTHRRIQTNASHEK